MIHFLQNYFKASYFKTDHLRVDASGVTPNPTAITKGGSVGRPRWMFTLPSGRVVICTDPRVIRPLVEAEELEKLLEGLRQVVLDSPLAAAQDTLLKAITTLLVSYAEVIYESTAEAVAAELVIHQEAMAEEQQKVAHEAYLQEESIFQANQRKRAEWDAVQTLKVEQRRHNEQLEEFTEAEEQANLELDAALDTWLDTQMEAHKGYEVAVNEVKNQTVSKVARLAVIKQLLEGALPWVYYGLKLMYLTLTLIN